MDLQIIQSGSAILIQLDKKIAKRRKLGWDLFAYLLKPYWRIDLRKSSKTFVPLLVSVVCCGTKLEVRRKKDFPTKDLKCKCGAIYLVKWEVV